MSLNDTPNSLRTRITFLGKRNAGKSSLVNAITGQELSVVSDVAGTTTDPVNKSMELLPLGPVVITDTAGYDDIGELGKKRIEKTDRMLAVTDIAVLVKVAGDSVYDEKENIIIEKLKSRSIPFITVYNKCELLSKLPEVDKDEIFVSAKTGYNINKLKEIIANLKPKENTSKMIGDFVDKGDFVVFVTPIDEAAPKGRLILPQQQAIRDTLDTGAIAVVVQPEELKKTLDNLSIKPKLIVTDSQVFGVVSKIVPEDIPLTSFSILVARIKGLLNDAVKGAAKLSEIQNGDKILISEGCTHHRQCNDIGTVKLPALIKKYTGKEIVFDFTSGGDFPASLKDYALIVHCGGCMITEKEMNHRVREAIAQNVPITNYGTAIAQINGILRRSLEILPELSKLIN